MAMYMMTIRSVSGGALDCSTRYKPVAPRDLDPVAALVYSHDLYFIYAVFYADLAETLSGALDRLAVPRRMPGADGRRLILTG